MECSVSLPHLAEPRNGPYREPVESILQPRTLFVQYMVNYFYICIDLLVLKLISFMLLKI
jgi:hypothetical protein